MWGWLESLHGKIKMTKIMYTVKTSSSDLADVLSDPEQPYESLW